MNNLIIPPLILPINREYSATSFSSTNIGTSFQSFHSELAKLSSKTLLVLVMFVAFVLVLFAEVAPKDMDENFHANDGNSFHEKFSPA